LLEQEGINPESKDKDGRTPLSWAAFNGHKEVVRLFLERKVNIDAKDNTRATVLHSATWRGHEAAVRLLLEKGADVGAKAHELDDEEEVIF
jgi:ankyrin repeat protein